MFACATENGVLPPLHERRPGGVARRRAPFDRHRQLFPSACTIAAWPIFTTPASRPQSRDRGRGRRAAGTRRRQLGQAGRTLPRPDRGARRRLARDVVTITNVTITKSSMFTKSSRPFLGDHCTAANCSKVYTLSCVLIAAMRAKPRTDAGLGGTSRCDLHGGQPSSWGS